MNNFIIEKLQHSDIEEIAIILTNAFETNHAYAAIFKNKSRLKEGLLWVFRTSLLINNQKLPLTMVIRDIKQREIIGTFTLIPPEGVKNSISIYSKIGIGNFIMKFGIDTFIRMISLDMKNKKVLKESLKNNEYYYLSMVVIKKEYQGKGIGSRILKEVINGLITSKTDCRLIGLTTQLPENVTFYSRLGFSILNEGYVSFRESRYYNYNMKFDLL